jgi:uncharacterized membrane protein
MEQVLTAPVIVPGVQPQLKKASFRIESIDFLRGLVMIIMALDHVRDFIHQEAFTGDPLNLATTTPWLFLTRFITHYCAPVFVFLAGTSAWFQSARKSKKELSLFLIKRGLWLIFIEVAIINFAFFFDVTYTSVVFQTIWSIGISMVVLGCAIWLPFKWILALGALIVLGHNALDFYEAGKGQSFSWWYSLLHTPGTFSLGGGHTLYAMYPFLPWAGLMMLGYCFGKLYTTFEGAQRNRVLLYTGLSIIAFFIVMRAIDAYGNPEKWSAQKNFLYSVFSFIDTRKYPPSLLFMCMTIGPAIVFLSFAGAAKSRLSKFITVFGKVPFFYYILHFYLIHLVSMALFFTRGHAWKDGSQLAEKGLFNFVIPGEGYSLAIVYLVWAGVILALYPVCKWYSDYKRDHKQWWLSYL